MPAGRGGRRPAPPGGGEGLGRYATARGSARFLRRAEPWQLSRVPSSPRRSERGDDASVVANLLVGQAFGPEQVQRRFNHRLARRLSGFVLLEHPRQILDAAHVSRARLRRLRSLTPSSPVARKASPHHSIPDLRLCSIAHIPPATDSCPNFPNPKPLAPIPYLTPPMPPP